MFRRYRRWRVRRETSIYWPFEVSTCRSEGKGKADFLLVMRLSKPALFPTVPIYGEEDASSFLLGQSRDIAIGNDHSVLSQLLILPYSFG